MKSMSSKILPPMALMAVLASCSREPKVIAPATNTSNTEEKSRVFSTDNPHVFPPDSQSELVADIHKVIVLEILPTVRYVYLRVREEQDEFWIATLKREVVIGATYFYQGGLLKTNFESREHKRVFDRMYLVSSIIEAEHSDHTTKQDIATHSSTNLPDAVKPGTTKIADLVADPTKFGGKVITVTGECVKMNPDIMGLNWIHLRDGSEDDFDLVITSDVQIPVGHRVTMTGKVVLNKDFGSGYSYSILLEDGKLVP